MKKTLILLPMAAVLLSLTGCKKDNEKSGPSGETVTLTATLGGSEKTEIDGLNMKWSATDAVIINEVPYTAKFPLGDYTRATFEDVAAADEYEAYYPTSLYTGGKYVLPATQTYNAENGNVLSGINPMYAVTTTKSLQFHNICALVKLQVKGEGTVNKIVVSSTTTPLCGEFEVRPGENGKYYAEIIDLPSADNKVLTLECSSAVTLKKDEATTFYIALPQGELQNLTFQVGAWATTPITTAKLTAGKLYTKELSEIKANVINGKFSVAADKQVNFSQGNLQYQASSTTWQFAANQYDIIGVGNDNASSTYIGWIDLFGWGTTGFQDTRAHAHQINYMPYSTSNSIVSGGSGINEYGYGPDYDVNNQYGLTVENKSDWGCVAGSPDAGKIWRTLSDAEWAYLLNTRATSSGVRYAKATVNGGAGVILVPDNWSTSTYSLQSINTTNAAFTVNNITEQTWKNTLEPAGCVFLPAAGYRSGKQTSNINSVGRYWSSTPTNPAVAYNLHFNGNSLDVNIYTYRYVGGSVRLVLVEN